VNSKESNIIFNFFLHFSRSICRTYKNRSLEKRGHFIKWEK
jgi:hypothetical protein